MIEPFEKIDGLKIEDILNRDKRMYMTGNLKLPQEIEHIQTTELEIGITDNGIGLPEHLIKQPSDLSRTSEPIVEKHRGKLELIDGDEGGWELAIKLPVG